MNGPKSAQPFHPIITRTLSLPYVVIGAVQVIMLLVAAVI
jgi:hypothetical protein